LNDARDRAFDRFQEFYGRLLGAALAHRRICLGGGGLFLAVSLSLSALVGLDFFPSVDAGLMKLHFRAPVGTRIEATERMVAQLERRIREIIPEGELEA